MLQVVTETGNLTKERPLWGVEVGRMERIVEGQHILISQKLCNELYLSAMAFSNVF